MKKKEIVNIFAFFILWLFFLSLVSFLAGKFFAYKPTFAYAYEFYKYGLSDFFNKMANFDGVYYLGISENGYLNVGLVQAFFPFYPFLIRVLNFFVHNPLISGLLISHLFALFSFYSFYYLVKMEHKQKIASWSLVFFAVFVSSFYLRSLYSESLFLTLIFTSLIAGKKKHYLLAGVLGALASATRVVGIFIWPSLLLMVFLQDRRKLDAYLSVSLSALGLMTYMLYLDRFFADPLYFFHMQEQFGANRQTKLVSYPQVIWRYLKIFWTVRPIDWKFYTYVQEFTLSLLALGGLVMASWQNFKKKIKINWVFLVFAWGSYLLPTLTGNFSSMPRYILVCFPLFIYMSLFLEKKSWPWRFFYLTINLILLIINLILFTQGYWVA
ncbi:MAG TPA: hypothetical protein PLQ50_02555 [Candidatus Woesebacteria bacterium]|nr:hypothetical protein [Candidatus Woesebacteria bacterium]